MTKWPHWVLLIQAVLLALILPAATVVAQTTPTPAPTPESPHNAALSAAVDDILARMTVADRIGQLFLITFEGRNVGFDSDIVELIHAYRVGGVVLSSENGNFSNEKGANTAAQAATLANQLQGVAYGVLLPTEQALHPLPTDTPPADFQTLEQLTHVPPVNIPLLIAVEQAGDALPATALRRGFTPLPSAMALGATWNPTLADLVGQTVGRELSAVGVNLLLGPVLDVLAAPRPDAVGGLGIHTFGGDPNWVSRMGQAYIAGVHTGGAGRVATIARHFPGAGDIDRLPDEEVATIPRNLSELEQVTLPPFVMVTRGPSTIIDPAGDPGATDAMMVSQARYSGFQGPSQGRNTPISLSPELASLLDREGMTNWRNQGGLLVSHALGSPAIRRYYSPLLAEFPSRRVAMDAFRAGNDLLYLARFSLDDQWETEKQNIKETIGFFQEQYVNDAEFAGQVDAAVRRILRLKLGLYDGDDGAQPVELADVLVTDATLTVLDDANRSQAVAGMGQVAREAMTLLYPDPTSEAMTRVPQTGEDILIFTDSRLQQECPTCIAEAAVGPDAIANKILLLYGPDGTGQILPDQVTSLTFADLNDLLATEETPPEPSGVVATPVFTLPVPVETPAAANPVGGGETTIVEGATPEPDLDKNAKTNLAIDNAEWLIFAMLDVDPQRYPNSDAIKRFLRLRGEQLANKEVVVLALNAPYFLDTTEISRLSAYYGVYSKTDPFLEGAVRALFHAFTPNGAPPVSVPGTRFPDLATRLQPNPAQGLPLAIYRGDGSLLAGSTSAAGVDPPAVDAGTVIQLQAGPMVDLNGKPLRDGTVVNFNLTYQGDPAPPRVEQTFTKSGAAKRDVTLDRGGMLQVAAQVANAVTSSVVALNVIGPLPVVDAPATETPPVALVPVTNAATLTNAAEIVVDPGSGSTSASPGGWVNAGSLAVALGTMAAMIGFLLAVQARVAPRRVVLNSLLWAINCGLAAYVLYAMGWLPGGAWVESSLRVWGSALVVFGGMLAPLLLLQLRQQ